MTTGMSAPWCKGPVVVFAAAVLGLGLAACGGDDSATTATTATTTTTTAACAEPPPSVPAPALPDGIPSPAGVVYTDVRQDPARLIVEGYAAGVLDEVIASYRSAFASRSLLTLRLAESQENRATLAIDGPSTKGSVTLTRACDRVDVLLELRPLAG